jgi:hypothetical protein
MNIEDKVFQQISGFQRNFDFILLEDVAENAVMKQRKDTKMLMEYGTIDVRIVLSTQTLKVQTLALDANVRLIKDFQIYVKVQPHRSNHK